MAATFNREAFTAAWNNHAIPVKRIAAALGITQQGVSWRAHRMGLPTREKNRRRKHDPALLRAMWIAGVSGREIAAHFGFSNACGATQAARNAGLPARERGPSGARNGGWKAHVPISVFWEQQMALQMHALAERDKDVARTKNRPAK